MVNPTLAQARGQISGERGKAIQAGLWPNPEVGYAGDQIGVRGPQMRDTAGEFQGGFIQQEIVVAGKRRLSREKYLARASAAEFQALAQEYRVRNDVRIHYYRALGAARRVEIQRELLKTAEDNQVTQRERFNVRQANEADVRQARALLQEQRLNVRAALNDEQMAWQNLVAVIGVPVPFSPLEGSLDA